MHRTTAVLMLTAATLSAQSAAPEAERQLARHL